MCKPSGTRSQDFLIRRLAPYFLDESDRPRNGVLSNILYAIFYNSTVWCALIPSWSKVLMPICSWLRVPDLTIIVNYETAFPGLSYAIDHEPSPIVQREALASLIKLTNFTSTLCSESLMGRTIDVLLVIPKIVFCK